MTATQWIGVIAGTVAMGLLIVIAMLSVLDPTPERQRIKDAYNNWRD